MRIAKIDRKLFISLAALVVTTFGASAAHAQFAAPTCTPPNCSPAVIQNIAVAGAGQNTSINVTGDVKIGATFQAGASTPTLNAAGQNLYYGNVNGASSAGSLMLLQNGGADRFRIDLSGNETVLGAQSGALGTVAAPAYTFNGDSNTGIYSPGADQVGISTGGALRLIVTAGGTTVSSSQFILPYGTAAAPGLTFTSDGNTGIFHSAADTLNFATNGVNAMTITSTNTVVVPGTMVVQTALIAPALGGDGSNVTNINANNITSGTVNPARLPANVAYTDANQTFSGINTFSNQINITAPATGIAYTNSVGGVEFYGVNENAFNFYTDGTIYYRIDANNNSVNSYYWLNGANSTVMSLDESGNLSWLGMTQSGGTALTLGNGQNLYYGLAASTSTGNLMLLQTNNGGVYTDQFSVGPTGNVYAAGTITSGGQQVCLANGTNCPPTLNGSGTGNYVTKFTGAGNTVGNSVIQDDGANVAIGAVPGAYKLAVAGTLNTTGAITSTSTISSTVPTGAAISGTVTAAAGAGTHAGAYGTVSGTGIGYGVYGFSNATGGAYGVMGNAPAGTGVYGSSSSGRGGYFYTNGGPAAIRAQAGAAPFLAIDADGDIFGNRHLTINGNATLGNDAADVTTVNGNLTLASNGALTLAPRPSAPVGVNGMMYLNSVDNKIYCFEAGAWNPCGASTGMTGNGVVNTLPKFTAATTLGNSIVTDNGTTVTVGGNLALTGQAADPVGANGTMYYNSLNHKIRCYENGSWNDCGAEADTLDTVAARGRQINTFVGISNTGSGFSSFDTALSVRGTVGGVSAVVTDVAGTAIAGSGGATGVNGAGSSYGGYFGASSAGGYGVYAAAFNAASTALYASGNVTVTGALGVNGEAAAATQGIRTRGTYGIISYGAGANATNYGGYFYSSGATSANNGLIAYGIGGTTATGVTGYASGGTTNYAFYASSGSMRTTCSTNDSETDFIVCEDIAEVYPTGEQTEPGDVIVWRPDVDNKVYKSRKSYDDAIAGIYSTSPGVLMGNEDANGKAGVEIGNANTAATIKKMGATHAPVALAGRVPVKVTLEGGAIKPGDLLTSSSKPGYAMKATKTGRVVCMAMEAFNAESSGNKILCYVNPHQWVNPKEYADLKSEVDGMKADIKALKARP